MPSPTLEEFLSAQPDNMRRGLRLSDVERALPPEGTDELARTAWGEGRGEGPQGMHAILNSVMNRTQDPEFSPDPRKVATNPSHFSAWQPSDPNFPKMQEVTEADENFKMATELARKALTKQLPDITAGATHYYKAGTKEPFWAPKMKPTKTMGSHKFFRKRKKPPTGGPNIEGLDD